MKEKFNEKVIPVILKFINTKGIQSIKNGMVTSMSPLIIGSIFLILSNFPVKAVVDVLESTGIKAVLDQACGATFSISAMIAVIGISYSYAKLENQEPLNCAIISLASFLILMPSSITTESGEVVGGIIDKTWTAGQGMIGAIIVGLIVPLVYCWFLKKNIRIKMLYKFISEMDELDSKILTLYLQGLTLKQISSQLGFKEAYIGEKYRKAINKLRYKFYKEVGGDI